MTRGRIALLACGLVWAAFCLALDAQGHEPTRAPLPRWYRLQAALLVPWLLLAGELYARLAVRLGAPEADPLRWNLGLPLLVAFVLPDILVWQLWGFDALFPAMLGYGAVAVLWSVVASVRAVDLPLPKALVAVLPAWLAQAVFASLLLR